jgi:hypothetical protein
MERMQRICGNCGGMGSFLGWKHVESNNPIVMLEDAQIVCTQCNGTGYTEYAVFSVEEAEAILKHCGLIVES